MSTYEDTIFRAVAALPSDPGRRQAAYDQARAALTARLESITPPLPRKTIAREQAALEEAIRRVEPRFSPDYSTTPPTAWQRPAVRMTAYVFAAVIGAALIAGVATFMSNSRPDKNDQSPRQAVAEQAQAPAPAQAPVRNPEVAAPERLSYVFMRQLVHYRSTNPSGTVVIDKAQRHLYVILANFTAVRFGIGLGGDCVDTAGRYVVSRKSDELPAPQVASALGISAGDRMLYLDTDAHVIQGTGSVKFIGESIKAGCFMLVRNDFAELYDRVQIGTRVLVN